MRVPLDALANSTLRRFRTPSRVYACDRSDGIHLGGEASGFNGATKITDDLANRPITNDCDRLAGPHVSRHRGEPASTQYVRRGQQRRDQLWGGVPRRDDQRAIGVRDALRHARLTSFRAVVRDAFDPHQSSQVLPEEPRDFVEWDLVQAVIQVDVSGVVDDHQFLRLRRGLVRILAEIARVRLVAGNNQERPR